MRKKVQLRCFFILDDNINFYKHVRDACIFNSRAYINYVAGYKCFMNFPHFSGALGDDFLDLDFWHKQYLSASSIDCAAVNKFKIKNFMFLNADCLHMAIAIQHLISKVLGHYFAKMTQNQKIELNHIHCRNLYHSINSC